MDRQIENIIYKSNAFHECLCDCVCVCVCVCGVLQVVEVVVVKVIK